MSVDVLELLDPDFGLYIWPSALVLTDYIAYRLNMFKGALQDQQQGQHQPVTILELGAGTALPSLLLAKATDSRLIITDRPDVPRILDNIREALLRNGIKTLYPDDPKARVMVQGLGWGDFARADGQHPEDVGLLQLLENVANMDPSPKTGKTATSVTKINIILGSDVFYHPPDFEPLLATVSYIILRHNPECVFLTTYQDRIAKRNIDHLLQKWGLEGRVIAWEDFNFDMSKYLIVEGAESEESEDDDDDEEEEEEEEEKAEHHMESEDARWLELAREEVERAVKENNKMHSHPASGAMKRPLVDYSSGSSSEDDMQVEEVGPGDLNRCSTTPASTGYRIGDGGALSSVRLLWICKQGYGDRFEAWRSPPSKAQAATAAQ
ncbi:Methyltransferase-like protein 23 [Mortierella claussenii]|nr:Methyltransferase-like protein 23 [Mortierella claussenii]